MNFLLALLACVSEETTDQYQVPLDDQNPSNTDTPTKGVFAKLDYNPNNDVPFLSVSPNGDVYYVSQPACSYENKEDCFTSIHRLFGDMATGFLTDENLFPKVSSPLWGNLDWPRATGNSFSFAVSSVDMSSLPTSITNDASFASFGSPSQTGVEHYAAVLDPANPSAGPLYLFPPSGETGSLGAIALDGKYYVAWSNYGAEAGEVAPYSNFYDLSYRAPAMMVIYNSDGSENQKIPLQIGDTFYYAARSFGWDSYSQKFIIAAEEPGSNTLVLLAFDPVTETITKSTIGDRSDMTGYMLQEENGRLIFAGATSSSVSLGANGEWQTTPLSSGNSKADLVAGIIQSNEGSCVVSKSETNISTVDVVVNCKDPSGQSILKEDLGFARSVTKPVMIENGLGCVGTLMIVGVSGNVRNDDGSWESSLALYCNPFSQL